ncbi:putative membrane protein [Algoriphagus sp. 4150]|nr:putative membrane protein [Algoriphagus sp. 4150]
MPESCHIDHRIIGFYLPLYPVFLHSILNSVETPHFFHFFSHFSKKYPIHSMFSYHFFPFLAQAFELLKAKILPLTSALSIQERDGAR